MAGFARWLIAVLLLLHGVPALATTAAPDAGDADRVRDCFVHMRGDPHASIALARALLEDASLSPLLRVRAMVCEGQSLLAVGDAAAADALAQQLIHLLDGEGLPAGERVRGYAAVASILIANGDGYRAIALMESANEVAQGSGDPDLRLVVLDMLAMIRAAQFEDHLGAEPYFVEAVALAETLGRGEVQRDYNHALNLVSLGRMADAEEAFDRALAKIERQGVPDLLRYRIQANRSDILAARGDHRGAREELEQAIAGQLEVHDVQGESVSRARLASALLADGETAVALESAQRALALAEQGHFAREQREALEVLVRTLATNDEPVQALAMLERLRTLEVEQLRAQNLRGMAALQAHLQNDAIELENERLQLQAERAQLLRNLVLILLALVVISAAGAAWHQHRLRKRLWRLGAIDPLTGLFNRREAARRLAALSDQRTRTALLLLDIDHFKAVNDVRGHGAGDQVLGHLADHLQAACRADDVVARWGGEEFLLACPGLSLEQAAALAERLRTSLAGMRVQPREGGPLSVTVSIGMAPFPFFPGRGEGTWQDAVRLADRALYAAKRGGRNAWAGVWGKDASGAATLSAVEAGLPQAADAGWVELRASRTMHWQSAATERRAAPTDARPRPAEPLATGP